MAFFKYKTHNEVQKPSRSKKPGLCFCNPIARHFLQKPDYDIAVEEPMQILFRGTHGQFNIGDELLLETFPGGLASDPF
jgi:hypothetical protein